ncbi:DUF5304 family protein [Streptomyces sp. DSM 44917]|uniref:DUF5304 family protein n=1 Tax=Streptomyces boetiae TaxID=3075541 RepID=A0ABU2LEA1_9ACTN|nr:DUF5304 family protein [Streptomyces sp. DSM 44917]MDT0309821.1 DUF5304 family protein [Streptomyces sp. DSM 44917]
MTEQPEPDAWAAACEEDLAAERARRQERYGAPPPDPAEEVRRLADSVAERVGRAFGPVARPLTDRARAALDPLIDRNAEVLHHLAGAGTELLAAYRAAALRQERQWTRGAAGEDDGGPDGGGRADGGGGAERIDLD